MVVVPLVGLPPISSLIYTRAHALILTAALSASQIRLTQGLPLLFCLPHLVRVKLDPHKGSCSYFDYRTQCGLSLIHTKAQALLPS